MSHAFGRYLEFYPNSTRSEMQQAQAYGVEMSPGMFRTLTGRRDATPGRYADDTATYVLHPERTGVFVVGDTGSPWTFIRFYSKRQHDAALIAYPEDTWPVTANVNWA